MQILYKNNPFRRWNFTKALVVSVLFHSILLFGIGYTFYANSNKFDNNKIVNLKLANSIVDNLGKGSSSNERINKSLNETSSTEEMITIEEDSFSVRKLLSNSNANDPQSRYLNAWQRKVETIGFYETEKLKLNADVTVTLKAVIDKDGEILEISILKSSGLKAFSGGASFTELKTLKSFKGAREFFIGFANLLNAFRTLKKFVILQVQGRVVGGGIGIVAACDYTIAHEKAEIKLSELSIGLGPFVIEPAITRKIGSATVYASYKESSRNPSIAELACADPDSPCRLPNSFQADPPLDMVVNRNLELGARGSKNYNLMGMNHNICLLYTSPSPRDRQKWRMPG